ncbi:MAG TPA: helix-hairpin-helix domain-containing protein, partial [Azonexus sp.]|nr:helix-hairpin-helix domain-containing protein [Azonexus sp.]
AEKVAPAAAAPVAEKAKAAAPAPAAAVATAGVSINTASAAELGAIKGVSSALAKAIVAGRPYAKLDDVVSAKGMGEKLLKKIRANLKL